MQLDIVMPDEARTSTVIPAAQLLKLPHQEACKERRRGAKKLVGTEKLFVKCWQTTNHHNQQTHMHSHKDNMYHQGANSQLLLVSNQKGSSSNNK